MIQPIINSISDLTNLKKLTLKSASIGNKVSYSTLKHLENLTEVFIDLRFLIWVSEDEMFAFPEDMMNSLRKVKKLTLQHGHISDKAIDAISKLPKLQELYLNSIEYDYDITFNSLSNASKLHTLVFDRYYCDYHIDYDLNNCSIIRKIPESIYSLPKLKKFVLTQHLIKTIPKKLAEIKTLEYLDLSWNSIDAELPTKLNDLTKLKYINLEGNTDIRGKTLTNKSLQECLYDTRYENLCKAKDMKCFSDVDYIKDCLPVSTNGKCGKKDGKCPSGQCCNKKGVCGTTKKYCNISQGCQSEFGKCIKDKVVVKVEIPTSTNGKCGKKNGKCPKGQCCSSEGVCGKSNKYCDVKKGCQTKYGTCKVIITVKKSKSKTTAKKTTTTKKSTTKKTTTKK